jgi:hypothetical protein
MANSKPLLSVACACENVLLDKNNVVSIIRIVENLEAQVPANLPPGFPPAFPLTLFVGIKAGDIVGTGTISIRARRPDGTSGGNSDVSVELSGKTSGANVRSNFVVVSPQDGTYWFDVFWNDEIPTSIPVH